MKLPLVFSISSGKGGVGKTNISVNLAYCLAQAGKRVLLLDADLGLANVDILLGLSPEKNIFHLFHEKAKLKDIIVKTQYNFSILPASSGIGEMLNLDTGQKLELLEAVDKLENEIDYLIVDTGAGIHDNVIYFNLAAQERIVILTPEPTSLTDAYALIKVLKLNHKVEHFKVIVNNSADAKIAKNIFASLANACDHFLDGVSLDYLGFIPTDNEVKKAVINQKPFCLNNGPASMAVCEIANNIQNWDIPEHLDGNIKFFWKKLLFRD